MASKVFVSGCFDLLHSGHAAFLKTAARFGDVYVGVGRDETVAGLKRKPPVNNEAERLFMVKSLRYVKDAFLNSGTGVLDFAAELTQLRPDVFVVNEDGHTPEKAALCARLGIEYRVLQREPEPGLMSRSSTVLRSCGGALPYRAELGGGWLDQPFISRLQPGYVVCAQLVPDPAFAQKCGGLATSTRAYLQRLQAAGLNRMAPEALAELTFRYENGVDMEDHPISGAQDALGLCIPGVSLQYYDGGYWPRELRSITDEANLRFLEEHLSLYQLPPRRADFDPLRGHAPRQDSLRKLASSAELCVKAVECGSETALSGSFTLCRAAQGEMFPAMFPAHVMREVERLTAAGRFKNWKFTGSGGGGWLLLLDAVNLPGTVPIKISACNPVADAV